MNEARTVEKDRTPGPKSPLRIWLLGAAVLVLLRLVGGYVPLTDQTGWLWITRIGEVWVVVGLVVWGWARLPVRDTVEGIGWARTSLVVALLVSVLVGQYIEVDAYPSVKWDMYTAQAEEAIFGRVEMVLAGGEREPLPMRGDAQLAKEPRAITGRLLALAEKSAAGDRAAGDLLEEALLALAEMAAPPRPRSLVVLRCSVTHPTADAPAECETLVTVPTEEAGS